MGPLTSLDALQVYKGKKVFITGHTGFKGSWMTSLLVRLGADVTGYALPPATSKNHFDLLGLLHNKSFRQHKKLNHQPVLYHLMNNLLLLL